MTQVFYNYILYSVTQYYGLYLSWKSEITF
jgi:hypothetical protein